MRPWRLAGPASGTWVGCAGHEVLDFDGVADRVNVGVAGLKVLVDADAAARADFQARVDGQLVFRPHAHAQDDQLSSQSLAGLQPDDQPAAVGSKPRPIDPAAA